MTEPRFRIDIEHNEHGWGFTVWDFADHGPDLSYAKGEGGDLRSVLDSATHYVWMAEEKPPILDVLMAARDIEEADGPSVNPDGPFGI